MYNKNAFLRMPRSLRGPYKATLTFSSQKSFNNNTTLTKKTKECKRLETNSEILEVTKPKIKERYIICKSTIWTDLHGKLHEL